MENLFGFIVAGFALTGSPGPATLSLAATGAAFGARRGLPYLAGISFGMILVMSIIATGVIGVIMAIPNVAPALTGMGGAYILYLAYRIGTAPPVEKNAEGNDQPSFFGGVFLSLVNPKAYAVMAALFSGFMLIEQAPFTDAALKITILFVICITVDGAWLFAGSVLTRFNRDPAINRAINVIFALLLIVSVAFALLF